MSQAHRTDGVEVIVGSAIQIRLACVPTGLLSDLKGALSVSNPAYVAAKRRGARVPSHTPRCLSFFELNEDSIVLPRGALSLLRALAARHQAWLCVHDRRAWPAERLDALPGVELRDYQVRAVEALVRLHQGVFRLPAGAGKTRAAIGAIAKLQTPALILVGSLDLAEQWRTQASALLGSSIGLVGGGEAVVEPITVATVQTLARWNDRELDTFLARFGLLVVDEAHHVASPTFRRIVGRCPAKYRLALTATPEREDGLGPVLELYCGPVLASVSHAELIEEGHLSAVETRELRTQFEFNYGGPDDWSRLLDAIWRDDARNALIVSAVEDEARAGHSVLVLTGRVEHAHILADQLLVRGVSARALVGTMAKRERAQALHDAREGRVSVLVATSLADEGLDLPCLSRCVLTFPAKAAGRTEQRLGRIMRPHGGKQGAVLIDVVDARVGVLRHQARKRAAVFRHVLGSAEARNAA